MHYDFLVVGAGLYAATVVHELKKIGKKCLVIDKRDHLGGNIYTNKMNGINVHVYGAHIFHTSKPEVWNYIQNFCKMNHFINAPLAVYKDELYNLPFNMNTFSKMWNIKTPAEAKKIIRNQIENLQIEEPKNLEEQALSLVGTDIYYKLIKGYTEKQWGRDCKDLPAFIIKRIPVRFTYDNNYFYDPYQGIPIGGYSSIIEKMLTDVDIKLNTEYFNYVDLKTKTTLDHHTFSKVLFTGPVDEFYNYKLGYLEYRSLRFEHEKLEQEDNFQGNAVVNYTEREVSFTRIIEHKHFEFSTEFGTVITKEYPQEWKPGVEPYYPVNDEKNMLLYQKYKALAEQETEILFGGRLGLYQYLDMDKTIEEALKMVQRIKNSI